MGLGIVRAPGSFLGRAVDLGMVGVDLAQSGAPVLDLAWTSVMNGT